MAECKKWFSNIRQTQPEGSHSPVCDMERMWPQFPLLHLCYILTNTEFNHIIAIYCVYNSRESSLNTTFVYPLIVPGQDRWATIGKSHCSPSQQNVIVLFDWYEASPATPFAPHQYGQVQSLPNTLTLHPPYCPL